ncbi:MAG TPA: hypothetical protein VJS12_23145 [Steroidobacteraceae bacterium]|nr:hypothetical protein [Steroidobacteraceae bacterium]
MLALATSLFVLTVCAHATDGPVTSSASVTREIDGTGRLDLVFVNQSQDELGVTLGSLNVAAEASSECRNEGARLESGAYGSSIDLLAQKYTTSTPPGAWAHRQLRVPASLMNVGCVLEIVAHAGRYDGRPSWPIQPALVIPLRAGYSAPLNLPPARGPAPAAATYSEFDVAARTHVIHVLYRLGEDAKVDLEVVADANVLCTHRGTQVSLTLPDSDRKLQDRKALLGAGQWSAIVLRAKTSDAGDGCSLTTKLVGRSPDGDSRPAAELSVRHTLVREREFSPDRPIP